MSSVCVLTPMIVGSWPIVANAIVGAAASMGFTIAQHKREEAMGEANEQQSVVTELANSEVVAESMGRDQRMTISKNGITLEFAVDDRGRCTVCASGQGVSRKQLKAVADAVSGKVVQQFAYHKLMTELKSRKFKLVEERVESDDSIQLRVRMDG